MKIKHQLSIAALVMVGVFTTGCSQQSAGGQQVDGGGQVAGGGQVSGSQQQVEAVAPVVVAPAPAPEPMAPAPMAPKPMAPAPKPHNPWLHGHPEAPKCAMTRTHSHKYHKTGARHRHHYACQQHAMAPKPTVDVEAMQRKLKAKGYYKGPIDGVVGPATRSALKNFMAR